MNKKVLKAVSVGATVVGAIVSIAGALAGNKLQDLEMVEQIRKAVENQKL